jgi:hypothetical protein
VEAVPADVQYIWNRTNKRLKQFGELAIEAEEVEMEVLKVMILSQIE